MTRNWCSPEDSIVTQQCYGFLKRCSHSKFWQFIHNNPWLVMCASGRSPGEGIRYPLQYSCLENPMDRGAWLATGSQSQSRTQLKPFSTHCLIDRTKYSAISYVEICFHSPSLHLPSLPSPCRFPIFLPFFSSSLSTCLLSVIVFFPPGT